MTTLSFSDLIKQADVLYDEGRFAEGLQLLTDAAPNYPEAEQVRELAFWRACLAAKAGQGDLALAILNEALEKGYWYPQSWLGDDALDSIRETDEYQLFVTTCKMRQQALEANSKPLLEVSTPGGEPPYPTIIALHGNESSPKGWVSKFRLAVTDGWQIALAQSSQVFAKDKFVWDNRDKAVLETINHYETLKTEYQLDPANVILGGFSMGAETALHLALAGAIQARGVIGVIPGGPNMFAPDNWVTLLETAPPPPDLRVALIAGTADMCYPGANRLLEILDEHGIAHKLMSVPDMGHDLPPNFRTDLKDALAFIMEG